MPDPASLNVRVSFTGLSFDELHALMRHMQPGACWEGTATQPAIGSMRFQVAVSDLSIKGAATMTDGLLSYLGDDGGRAENVNP